MLTRGKFRSKSDYVLMILDGCVALCVLFLLLGLYAQMLLLGTFGADDFEHEAASWFIYNGFVPYRDFFQHHHPLLWYLTAPLYGLLDNPVTIYCIGRILAALTFCGTLIWLIKIVKSLGGNGRSVLYTVFILLSYPITFGNYIQNRPDTYMIFCLLGGLYYWIRYVQVLRTRYLVVSYLLFFLSFAFLQKVILILLPFGIFQAYLLYHRKLDWKAVGKALVIPIVSTLAYGGYLIASDSFARYFELNWILNAYWYRNYTDYAYDTTDMIWGILACLTAFYGCCRQKGMTRSLCGLFLGFALLFWITPKPYFIYWLPWVVLSSPMLGLTLARAVKSGNRWLKYGARLVLILSLIIGSGYCHNIILTQSQLSFEKDVYHLDNWTQPFEKKVHWLQHHVKSPDDLVDYGDFTGFLLFPYPRHYYYFALSRGAIMDSRLFHRHQPPDWDAVVFKTHPKYLIPAKIYDRTNADNNDTSIPIQGLPDAWVKEHYTEPKMMEGAWKRKD